MAAPRWGAGPIVAAAAAAAAAATLLAGALPTAAGAPTTPRASPAVNVVRMRPIDLSGTYTRTFRRSASTTCPDSMTLASAEAFVQVDSIRRPHADIAMRFPAAGGLMENGAACTGGGLIAVTSLSTYQPTIMAAIEQPDAAKTLVLANEWARRMTHWADVVGLGLSTWTCEGAGGGTPRWAPTQWAAFGESDWVLDATSATPVELGGGNRSLAIVTTTESTGTIDCVLAAPPRRVVADAEGGGSPVGSTPGAGGEGDTAGVSGAAAAGIAVAAAVAAAAVTAGLIVAVIVVRRRRRRGGGGTDKATGGGAPVAGAAAAAGGGGGGSSSGVLPSPLPSLVGPSPAAAGWALPTYGDGSGGVGTAVKPPWGLGESLALPPPMPDALRETADSSVTTETPSSGRRDTSSAAHSGRS